MGMYLIASIGTFLDATHVCRLSQYGCSTHSVRALTVP